MKLKAMLAGLVLVMPVLSASSIGSKSMELGNFSVSLAVKDIGQSKAFYEKFGFVQIFGDTTQGWAIMRNGDAKIGLFQGMFEKNLLTFNPGWDHDGKLTGEFEDIRRIHKRLKASGVDVGGEIESESGPASFMVTDPDGNPILVDQHL